MSTFYDRFRECAERWPEHIALEILRRDGKESYTYAETRRIAESIGRWLVEAGFTAGARCAILAENHPRWVVAYLGVIAAGCTVVPLDTALHPDQVAKLLKDSGASLIFCDRKHLLLTREAVQGLPLRIVLTDPDQANTLVNLDSIFAAGSGGFVPVSPPEDAVAVLLYTSGTTADPKGVMLTHANILGEVSAVFGWAHFSPEDALLGVLPLFHVLSQMANLLLPMVKGVRVVYLETLNTTELIRALGEANITAFAVVPQFFYLIHDRIFKQAEKRGTIGRRVLRWLMAFTRLARQFGWNPGKILFPQVHKIFGANMRYLVTGGSRFDPHIALDFHALGIDVLQAYGLTETSAAAFATSPEDNVIGSVGKALAGVEGKIVHPQPQQDGLPAVGEIAIRGAIVMKGYWNRPDATAAVLKDGWLHTGDLGYFDAGGNLFITGRQKEVIVLSNGKNIYPEEIEAHYLKSPYIKEICVMGLEGRPGDPASERLHAVVVSNFEVLKERKIVNTKEVIRFDIEGLSAQLTSTKRIGSYEIWQQDLPRTTTRKLKRFEIEKRVRANQAGNPSAGTDNASTKPLSPEDGLWLDGPEVQRAVQIIGGASKTRQQAIHPADNLELDLGLDSMDRVELLAALEQEFGGDVAESRLVEIYTVRELVDVVLENSRHMPATASPRVAGWKNVLRDDDGNPEFVDLVRPRPAAETFCYALSRLAQIIALDRFQLKVHGLENLPRRGPYLICSNHQSFLDPIVMASVLPAAVFRRLFSVGTSEIFGAGFMRRLAHWLRVVVVDPDANLVPAMRAGAFGLRHGRILILYPEGERSMDGTPRIFKKGAAILSIHLQAPIVPVAIAGFHTVWPRGTRFPKAAPLQIAFGNPLYPPPDGEASEAAYESFTAELKARIVSLWEGLRQP